MNKPDKKAALKVIDGQRQTLERRTLLSIIDPSQGDYQALMKSLEPTARDKLKLIDHDETSTPDDQKAPPQVV